MEPDVAWGTAFAVYILSGLVTLSLDPGPEPKNTPPGSLVYKQWKAADAKATRWQLIWGVGFVALLIAWSAW